MAPRSGGYSASSSPAARLGDREKHIVTAVGCDDENPVSIDLTDAELAVVQRLAARLKEQSRGSCMPTLKVKPYATASQRDKDYADGKDT